jgi:hypothetical protein
MDLAKKRARRARPVGNERQTATRHTWTIVRGDAEKKRGCRFLGAGKEMRVLGGLLEKN